MALPASCVWEVRTTGNDANGGGFSSARSGTDYSQQDAAQLSLTDLACASNTTLTSATGGFTAAMVGNIIQIASGTNAAAGFYEVTAYTSTNQVTIDRTCASGGNMSSGVGKLGGALATPGKAATPMIAGNTLWIKYSASAYPVAATIQLAQVGSYSAPTRIQGYDSSRGDFTANRPTLQATANDVTILNPYNTCAYLTIANLIVDGNSGSYTGTQGIMGSAGAAWPQRVHIYKCRAINCNGAGGIGKVAQGSVIDSCEAIDCGSSTKGIYSLLNNGGASIVMNCYADSCGVGFQTEHAPHVNCIAIDCGYGFVSEGNHGVMSMFNCVAYSCDSGGFYRGGAQGWTGFLQNCIAVNNTGYGFRFESSNHVRLHNCAYYNNSSGNVSLGTAAVEIGGVLLTGDPFVNAAAGDFRLDRTASEGLACRAAGIGPYGQTSYPDIGAVQHGDTTVPAVGDVESGVKFGDGAALTGTFVVPAEEDVEDGVTYGAGGTEFEGTLAGGGGGVDLPDVMTIGA